MAAAIYIVLCTKTSPIKGGSTAHDYLVACYLESLKFCCICHDLFGVPLGVIGGLFL